MFNDRESTVRIPVTSNGCVENTAYLDSKYLFSIDGAVDVLCLNTPIKCAACKTVFWNDKVEEGKGGTPFLKSNEKAYLRN